MTSAARWSIAGLVLVVAAVIAIWPRHNDPADPADPAPTPAAAPAPDLAAARADAALPPCPAASGRQSAMLTGVHAQCLADGSRVDLARTLAGGPVLVNVWATWCAPCKEELPLLARYAAEKDAVPVVGLAVQSKPEDALELLGSLKVRLPMLADADGSAGRALKLPAGLPASYVVGADGQVRLVSEPRLFSSLDQIRTAVATYGGAA